MQQEKQHVNHLRVPGSTLSVEGVRAGVSGTPTFYINGQQLVGAQPIEAFVAVIDAELAK